MPFVATRVNEPDPEPRWREHRSNHWHGDANAPEPEPLINTRAPTEIAVTTKGIKSRCRNRGMIL